MARTKANKAQTEKAIMDCIDNIVRNNFGWQDWREHYEAKYGINSQNGANNIWKQAWERIQEKSSKDVESKLDLLLHKLDAIEHDAIEAGDRRTWLDTTKYRGKIYGLESENLNVNLKGEIKFDFGSPIPIKKEGDNNDDRHPLLPQL